MIILKKSEPIKTDSKDTGTDIRFWSEEFIKHTGVTEFTNSNKYRHTILLNLMKKRVLEYIASNNISNKQNIEALAGKFFTTTADDKYMQMEQRKLLQAETRNEGVPLALANVIVEAYKFPKERAFFFGERAIGIKADTRKTYLKGGNGFVKDNQALNFSGANFFSKSVLELFPPAINSHRLNGYWLSKFTYKAKREDRIVPGIQYDLEHIVLIDKYSLVGKNILCLSGSGKEYFHDLKMQIVSNYLLGAWYNTNTKNMGVMQLYIHTNNLIMSGKHLGNSNDNSIQEGEWTWIKLKEPDGNRFGDFEGIKNKKLIQIDQLDENFNKWLDHELQVKLEDILCD